MNFQPTIKKCLNTIQATVVKMSNTDCRIENNCLIKRKGYSITNATCIAVTINSSTWCVGLAMKGNTDWSNP